MDFFQRLRQRIRVLVFCTVCVYHLTFRAIYFDTRRAGSGEEMCGCGSDGEDVCRVGIGDGVGLKVLLRLCEFCQNMTTVIFPGWTVILPSYRTYYRYGYMAGQEKYVSNAGCIFGRRRNCEIDSPTRASARGHMLSQRRFRLLSS